MTSLATVLALVGLILVGSPYSERRIESATWDWVVQDDGEAPAPNDIGVGAAGPSVLRWPEGTRARFLVNPNAAPPGAVDAVRSAVATWMRTGIDVSLDYGGTTALRGASPDVVNVVSWAETPLERDVFVARTTTYWFADAPDEIIGFDLVFNLDHVFGPELDGWDVETIALHEFGHVLGLGHADPERVLQVMRPRIHAGEVDHTLSLRDLEALAALYGGQYVPAPQGFFAPAPDRVFRASGGGSRPGDPGLFD